MTFIKLRTVLCIVGSSLAIIACSDTSGTPADVEAGAADTSDGGADSSTATADSGRDSSPGPDGGGPVNECADGSAHCDLHATCTDLANGFTCACKPGYTGDGKTCTDVNECTAVNNCAATAKCTNTPGGFTCACDPGYTGNGVTCTDVDECTPPGVNDCAATAKCTNTPGGFACTCKPGYTGDGKTCTDVDECTPPGVNNCATTATCTNTPGAFTCACKPGYAGNGVTCADVDECTPPGVNNCAAIATCTNTTGSFTCTCPPGTSGDGTMCTAAGQSCAQAVVVDPASLPKTFTGDTTFATPHYGFSAGACPGVPGAAGAAANDVAYSFTPTTSATYRLTLSGTNFDSALYVTTDCANVDGTCVGAVDNACSGCAESVSVNLTAGTTYYIVVDGSSNGKGTYNLGIKKQNTFADPLQVDVSALLLHDTIVNNGNGGVIDAVQDGVDGQANKLATQSVADKLHAGFVNVALPDTGTFAADGNHPFLQLGWNNANDGFNSRIVKQGGTFTIPVPADTYTQFQVYAVSSEGNSSMQFTLHYSDGSTDVRNITFGDWYNDPAGTGTFFIINGLDRVTATGAYEVQKDPAMAGANLNPTTTKTLTSVDVNHLTSNGWFVFYGATAW